MALTPPTPRIDCIMSTQRNQPAEVVHYGSPSKDVPWLPVSTAVEETWSYSIHNAVVAPTPGAVWLPDGSIAVELSGGRDRIAGSQDVRGLARSKAKEKLTGNWAIMPSHTYYHFLLEDVPALLSSLRFLKGNLESPARVLVAKDAPAYVSDFVKTLGIPIHLTMSKKVCLESLVATGFASGGKVHPASISQIREHFGVIDNPGSEQIYVSRVGFRRSFPWEGELIKVLTEALPRLRVIEGHRLTLNQQVDLFSRAELVIGTHGAGLSNIVFSPTSTRIVEIGSSSNFGDHFWRLSSLRKQQYSLVWIKPELTSGVSIKSVLEKTLTH